MAYAAYLIFRVPPPTLISVEPAVLTESPKPSVRVTGSNLLPYLSAYVAPAGEPLPRYLNNRAQTDAVFLIESPEAAVIQLPPLTPGSYDLYLFDESRELTRVNRAVTIEPLKKPAPRVSTGKTVAQVRTRAQMPSDLAMLMKAGDIDRYGSPTDSGEPDATIVDVTRQRVPNPTPGINDYMIVVMDLRIPVSRIGQTELWSYKGQRIRVGESVSFGTPRYVTQGLIIEASFPPDVPWDTER
jgi:hypothetical protein